MIKLRHRELGRYRESLIWCFLVVMVVSSKMAYADAEKAVTLAVFSRAWPPFEIVRGQHCSGATVDLFNAIMPDDLKKEIVAYPSPRSTLVSKSGPIHARLDSAVWMKDDSAYWWSELVVTEEVVLLSPASNPIEYKDENSLHGLKIGCVEHYSYPSIEDLFENCMAERYNVNHEKVLLRMLKARRIDVAVLDRNIAEWLFRESSDVEKTDFFMSKKPLNTIELRFVFNKVPGWETQVRRINDRIRLIRENGTIDAIMSRYR